MSPRSRYEKSKAIKLRIEEQLGQSVGQQRRQLRRELKAIDEVMREARQQIIERRNNFAEARTAELQIADDILRLAELRISELDIRLAPHFWGRIADAAARKRLSLLRSEIKDSVTKTENACQTTK